MATRFVPKSRAKLLEFYRLHAEKWLLRADEIGIDPTHAAELQALVLETRLANLQQRRALAVARAATIKNNQLLKTLRRKGGAMLKAVQARAVRDESVYDRALIPRRRKRSPMGKPGMPYGLSTSLCVTGALTLKWKCRQPRGAEGTIYRIRRQLGHGAPLVHLADVGKKEFTDTTIPPGTASVNYEIRARRSTREGLPQIFNLRFGGGMGRYEQFSPAKAA